MVKESGYFTRICDIHNKGAFREYADLLKSKGRDDGDKILLKEEDFDYLKYCDNGQLANSEIYANIMYLADIEERELMKYTQNKKVVNELKKENLSVDEVIKSIEGLKLRCIKEIIGCKENGENLECVISEGKGDSKVFYVAMPRYLEAFKVDFKYWKEIDKETIDKYLTEKRQIVMPFRAIFPIKLSRKKEKLIKNNYTQKEGEVWHRICWFEKLQKGFKDKSKVQKGSKEKSNSNENEKKDVIERIVSKKYSIEEQKRHRQTLESKHKELEEIKAEMEKFLKGEIQSLEDLNEMEEH